MQTIDTSVSDVSEAHYRCRIPPGFVPVIHVFDVARLKTSMPATGRGHDETKVLLAGEIGHAALCHGLDALLEIGGVSPPALLRALLFCRLRGAVGDAR